MSGERTWSSAVCGAETLWVTYVLDINENTNPYIFDTFNEAANADSGCDRPEVEIRLSDLNA